MQAFPERKNIFSIANNSHICYSKDIAQQKMEIIKMEVKKHVLKTLAHPVDRPLRTMGYKDFVSDPDWQENLISFTSLLYHPQHKKVICGMTSFDNDLMYEFDPETGVFSNLGFQQEAEKFEIKIHRSLHLDQKGNIYGATAPP